MWVCWIRELECFFAWRSGSHVVSLFVFAFLAGSFRNAEGMWPLVAVSHQMTIREDATRFAGDGDIDLR
jgi:hypothetical protein